jgi:hypothetical protein
MYEYSQTFAISIYAFSDLGSFEIVKKKSEMTFGKARLIFSLQEGKYNETEVAEQYCWAITQASG